jgi:hypothetical protein
MLKIENLTTSFGSVIALDGVSMSAQESKLQRSSEPMAQERAPYCAPSQGWRAHQLAQSPGMADLLWAQA